MLLTEIHQECADRNYWSPHEIEINRIQNDLDWIHSPKHFYTGRIYRKTPGDQFRTFGQGLNLGDSTPLEPSAIAGVQSAIEQAQWILSLPADWDENGAEPISFETFTRMSKLVRRVHSVVAATIPLPEISPIPDGSIDVHWRSGDRLFALNVPATPDQPPTCYLRGNDGTNLKGTLGEGLEALDVKWLLF